MKCWISKFHKFWKKKTCHCHLGHKNLVLSDKSVEPPLVLLGNSKQQQRWYKCIFRIFCSLKNLVSNFETKLRGRFRLRKLWDEKWWISWKPRDNNRLWPVFRHLLGGTEQPSKHFRQDYIYLVRIRALITHYQTNTDRCTHILPRHHFVNIIRQSNMFRGLG